MQYLCGYRMTIVERQQKQQQQDSDCKLVVFHIKLYCMYVCMYVRAFKRFQIEASIRNIKSSKKRPLESVINAHFKFEYASGNHFIYNLYLAQKSGFHFLNKSKARLVCSLHNERCIRIPAKHARKKKFLKFRKGIQEYVNKISIIIPSFHLKSPLKLFHFITLLILLQTLALASIESLSLI